jgi:hypothetical protein
VSQTPDISIDMQREKFEMYDCLINWIKVLKVPAQEAQEKMDLSDGVSF